MIEPKLCFKKAASTIEYMALICFFIAALLAFDQYILRAFWGQWRRAGQVFGHGRQYDPRTFGSDGNSGGTLRCTLVIEDPDDPYDHGCWTLLDYYDECLKEGGSIGQCKIEGGAQDDSVFCGSNVCGRP